MLKVRRRDVPRQKEPFTLADLVITGMSAAVATVGVFVCAPGLSAAVAGLATQQPEPMLVTGLKAAVFTISIGFAVGVARRILR